MAQSCEKLCVPHHYSYTIELVDATPNDTLCCEIFRVYNVIYIYFFFRHGEHNGIFLGRKGLGTVLLLSCLFGGFKKSESQLTVSDDVKQKNVSFKIVKLVHFNAYSTYLVAHLFKR